VEHLRQQQPRRASADDPDLGAHGHLGSPQCPRADFYRRAKQAGIATQIGCHTFRATGITIYLTNGGTFEQAQRMAAHESPRTTKLYDPTSDAVSLDEVERVVF
jgi:integrase